MKIAIVTWITYNNYGTILQAYALQQYLLQQGYESCIISDKYIVKPWLLEERNKVAESFGHKLCRRLKRCFTSPAGVIRDHLLKSSDLPKTDEYMLFTESQRKISDFKSQEMMISDDMSYDEIGRSAGDYDIFICGSDQIWSCNDRDFNGYFYLNFTNKVKIAYAPSFGSDVIPLEKQEQVIEWLKSFQAISAREDSAADMLTRLMHRKTEWVCDPTLLMNAAFWHNIGERASDIPKEKYLLCYFLDNQEWYFAKAQKLASLLDLRIILIPGRKEYASESFEYKRYVHSYPVGINEFVGLIDNASYVLTDSYHGSLFALQFQKEFLYLKRFANTDVNSQNLRITSLYNYLHISDRIIESDSAEFPELSIPNYPEIQKLLQNFREDSQNYLINNLH